MLLTVKNLNKQLGDRILLKKKKNNKKNNKKTKKLK